MDNIKRIIACDTVSSLTSTSIEIFYRHLYSIEGRYSLDALHGDTESLSSICEKFTTCKPTDALWIILMLECYPTEKSMGPFRGESDEEYQVRLKDRLIALKALEKLNDAFDKAVKIPSGLRLKHEDFGNCHINVASLPNIETSSQVAVRILLVLVEHFIERRGAEVKGDERILNFLKAYIKLDNSDSMTRLLAVRATAQLIGVSYDVTKDYAVQSTPLRDIISSKKSYGHIRYLAADFMDVLFDGLVLSFSQLEESLDSLRQMHERIYHHKEVLSDLSFEYHGLLFEVCKVDAEEDLVVPIGSYLRDNENLRLARANFQKAQERLIKLEADMLSHKESLAHMLPSTFVMVVLCTHVITLAIHEDVAELPLVTDLYFVNEEDDTVPNAGSKMAVKHQLDKIPWSQGYRNLCSLERVVHGSCFTQILAVVACRWFASYQEKFSQDERMSAQEEEVARLKQSDKELGKEMEYTRRSSQVRSALNDLSNPAYQWRYVKLTEEEEGWTPKTRRSLHRPLRRLSHDTRILTALVFWAGLNNPRVARKLLLWKPELRGPVSSATDDTLMWKRLLFRSNIVDSQDEGDDLFDPREIHDPPYEPEYKEYVSELADDGLVEYLQSDYYSVMSKHRPEDVHDSVGDSLKLCTDRRASLYFGVAYCRGLSAQVLQSDCAGLEGSSELSSLRGNHPLSVVLLLLSHEELSETAALQVATGRDQQLGSLLGALIQTVRQTLDPGNPRQDYLLHCISAQALALVLAGPYPAYRSPSKAMPFEDQKYRASEGFRSGMGEDKYEHLRLVLRQECGVLYSEAVGHLCPLGASAVTTLSASLRLVTALSLVLNTGELHEQLLDSCVESFDLSFWNAATLGDYKVQKAKEKRERRCKAEELSRRGQENGDGEWKDEEGEMELRDQGYQSFVTPFLFLIKDGLAGGILSRLLDAAKWRLSAAITESLVAMCENKTAGLVVLCDYLELYNVLLLHAVPDSLTSQANFLAESFLHIVAMDGFQWPSSEHLHASPDRALHLNHRMLDLRARCQFIKISSLIINSGRVARKPLSQASKRIFGAAKVGEGEGDLTALAHTSLANEYVLYITLSEGGHAIEVASSMLARCSKEVRVSVNPQEEGPLGTEYGDNGALVTSQLHLLQRDECCQRVDDAVQDTVYIAIEFITHVCTKRLELQSIVAERCAPLFFSLPVLSTPAIKATSRFQLGLAVRVADLIGVLAYRHEACIARILESGCIEALFRGLEECCETILPSRVPTASTARAGSGGLLPPPSGNFSEREKKRWAASITNALQIIVNRDVRAWEYCQQCSGLGGVFKVIQLGNPTIKKLCVSTLLDHAVAEETGRDYVEAFVATGGLVLATRLLQEPLLDIVLGTLRVIKVVAQESATFRSEVLSDASPRGAQFLRALAELFGRTPVEPEVQSSICRILDMFCAQDAEGLRRALDGNGNMLQQLVHLSSSRPSGDSDEMDKTEHAVVAQACARTLANLTESEESDFLAGSSSPLRSTLTQSGILPTI